MRSGETTLRLLLAQVRFELVEAAAALAERSRAAAEAEDELEVAQGRSDAAASQLREAMMRRSLNPALLTRMHHIYLSEQLQLQDRRTHGEAARQREERASEALSELRNQERSLERVLRAQARQARQRRQVIEALQADELWLHRQRREMA